ncbi:hypothetical protein DFH08DRAFT_964581 [Mycena albidolilacea]|uniref:Uncharacterized protein n=1 Tax=Mycena albidolilacea TaxID=1033008 RepID=A0AAD6ZT36_9AGAR|nr:hypothetical protein DFH08DRAFT_964581 [Mycena albidolilacea]
MSGRQTLHSGKEFSTFDLAVGRAIALPIDFDVGHCLQQRLDDLDSTGFRDEPDEDVTPFPSLTFATPVAAPAPSTSSLPAPPLTSLSSKERSKVKSRLRRDKARTEARLTSTTPLLKAVNLKRIDEAKTSALELDLDASALPHSKPAWIGSRSVAEDPKFSPPHEPHDLDTGLSGLLYTQAEVDALSGTENFMYINWLGRLTIPILDRHQHIIALLGGTPRDTVGWQTVTDGASQLLLDCVPRIRLTEERMHHRRAQEPFPAIARGVSHGGGQTELGELRNNIANTQLTDELLVHEYFCRLAGFANILFAMWAPLLFAFYQAQIALLDEWKPSIRWNFAGSVFAACTFNFGPRVITAAQLDFANLAWGWCAITALGKFDPDIGGHLILWDLRLVVRFPPGSTILLPSAIIRHSNVPIRAHEHRCSFTQYTAGGLFRWVRNGFKTDEAFHLTASVAEKAEREAESKGRWERGMKMFSVIDEL